MQQPPSDLCDRYRVGDLLARGGMADVYAGFDVLLERPVAIKVLHTEAAEDAPRLLHETQTLARLNHPAIVRLFDAGAQDGQLFLVMELVEGASLRDRLRSGPLTGREAVEVGRWVAGGLAHAHAARVVHRDVKPANILLGDEEPPRLADFGIARLLDGTRTTIAGATMGTAAYLAPEQVGGDEVTEAADVYALGLVLLEALTGRPAFVGTAVEVALARLSRRPDIPASLGPAWAALLGDMTERDPVSRPTAEAVARRLEDLAAGSDPTTALAPALIGAGAASSGSTAAPRRRLRIAAGVAASTLVLASAAVLAGARQPAPPDNRVDEAPPAELRAELEPAGSEEPVEPAATEESVEPAAQGSTSSAGEDPSPIPEPEQDSGTEVTPTEAPATEEPAEPEPEPTAEPRAPDGDDETRGEGSGGREPSETEPPDPPPPASPGPGSVIEAPETEEPAADDPSGPSEQGAATG